MGNVLIATKEPTSGADEIIEVALHPALIDAFKDWLMERGLHLAPIPYDNEEHLPMYIVTINEDKWIRS